MSKEDLKKIIGHITPRQVWCHIEEIVASGISIDEIIEIVGEPYPLYFAEHCETLLQYGANPSLLADYLIKRNGYLEEEGYLFALAELRSKGATKVDANKIIDSLTFLAYAYRDEESIKTVKEHFYKKLKPYADTEHLSKLLR